MNAIKPDTIKIISPIQAKPIAMDIHAKIIPNKIFIIALII
jgi:hypothetical protein